MLYLYHMDKPGKYGEDHSLVYPSGEDVVFTPGRWFRIVERVKVNSGDNRDGECLQRHRHREERHLDLRRDGYHDHPDNDEEDRPDDAERTVRHQRLGERGLSGLTWLFDLDEHRCDSPDGI